MSDNVDNISVETSEDTAVKVAETLTAEQEIGGLRRVHQFLSEFDRVPGSMSSAWSQMLDTIAVVANSLIAKVAPVKEEVTSETTESAQ